MTNKEPFPDQKNNEQHLQINKDIDQSEKAPKKRIKPQPILMSILLVFLYIVVAMAIIGALAFAALFVVCLT